MGSPIRLECANYLLRTMEPADALIDWSDWLANPTTARLLNTTPRVMNEPERRAYIEKFETGPHHLLGIWEKANGALIGFWQVQVDEERKEFLINVLIGVEEARFKGAQDDTCDLIYEHFFDQLGMVAVRCSALERNERMIDHLLRRRWTHVGTNERPGAAGARPVVIHLFRLSREDWRARFESSWSEDRNARLSVFKS
jgi:RimJ/RimL family protein N-acetyltransferase